MKELCWRCGLPFEPQEERSAWSGFNGPENAHVYEGLCILRLKEALHQATNTGPHFTPGEDLHV